MARASAVNTVAVISRADEIGGGRVDAMFAARGIAQRYRTDPTLRGLCQNVVAVAGLLAETGRTLRQAEFAALAELAARSREAELDVALLLASDRFLRRPRMPARPSRHALLRRFGMFGIRLSTMLIRQGADSPAALAAELVARSGLPSCSGCCTPSSRERRDLLKARSALLALDRVLRSHARRGRAAAAARSSGSSPARTSSPSCGCSRALRSGLVDAAEAALAGRPNGCSATPARPPHRRLGLPADADRRPAASGGVRGAGPLAAARREPDVRPRHGRRLPGGGAHLRGHAGRPAHPPPEPRGPHLTRHPQVLPDGRLQRVCVHTASASAPSQHGYQPQLRGSD